MNSRTAFALLIPAAASLRSGRADPLPANATVIERAVIPRAIHADRELVLWMISPEKNDRGPDSEAVPYTCPEVTQGSYYYGPTRISLIDTARQWVINTVKVSGSSKGDSFDIPYRILADYYYLVPGRSPRTEGKPAFLSLRDFNGDGVALETAFFEALACMGLPTTLIGYSPKRDRILQYPVVLRVLEQKQVSGRKIVETRVETTTWIDYVFSKPPLRPGYWFFTIDYRGRGGSLATYDVHYEAAREQFAGTLTLTPP